MNINDNKPLVSVITACFNETPSYLLECIESVEQSTYENIEHVVIDDGSTNPATIQSLDELATRKQITLIRTSNNGVCEARNIAIRRSSGKYILTIDSDDKIGPDYISLAVNELEQNDNIKIVATNYQLIGKLNYVITLEPYSIERLLGHNLFVNCSLYRRVDFDRINGYNVNMNKGLEDWDFWIGIMENGGEVKYLDSIQFYYRIKPSSQSRNASIDEKKHKNLRRQIWENHKELYSRVFFDPTQSFEYLRVANSKEYRLGRILLMPIRKLLGK